eukprot:6892884-Prymnesium_polylepis.3
MAHRITAAADALMSGTPAREVIETMRQYYKTDASLAVCMSNVRRTILDSGRRPEEFDVSALHTLAATEDDASRKADIDVFLAAPAREQYRIQRSHASNC